MRRSDREQRAQELGRSAYGRVVPHKMPYNLEINGEFKKVYEIVDDGLCVTLTLPFKGRDADRHEMSRLTVRLDDHSGTCVLDIEWNRLDHFEIVRFVPGGDWSDWEQIVLWDWDPPMPF